MTSYVAGDKIYCLHETEDAETILEHARRGGFPANMVSVVATSSAPTPPTGRRRVTTSPARRRACRPGQALVPRRGALQSSVDLLERDRELDAARPAVRRSRRRQGGGSR